MTDDSDLDAMLAGPRVLVIDLERIPGSVTLDIFDAKQRSDYIHASKWQSYPETLCFSWRWLGERQTHFAATWTHDSLAELSWSLYNEATHVLGYNQRKADNKWCRADWLLNHLAEPAPWRDIDLYVTMSQFGLEARSMDFTNRRLSIPGKKGHYSIAVARAAAAGDEKAQRSMERYNRADVAATIALFERVRPLAKFPGLNLGLFYGDDQHRCPKCGSTKLTAEGWASTPQTRYAQYRCDTCGGLSRSANRKHSTTMRGVT